MVVKHCNKMTNCKIQERLLAKQAILSKLYDRQGYISAPCWGAAGECVKVEYSAS